MVNESDKCGCGGSMPTIKSDCPEKPNDNSCCGSSLNTRESDKFDETKGQCSKRSEFFKEKSQCPKANKEKCHSSQEQFKKQRDQCGSASEGKCNEHYKTFLRGRKDTSPSTREEKGHESPSALFSKKAPDKVKCPTLSQTCPSSTESPADIIPCSSSKETNLCNSSKSFPKQDRCKSTEDHSCQSSKKSIHTENPCISQAENLQERSTLSKVGGYCKNLAKQYVSLKSNGGCSNDNVTRVLYPKGPSELPPSKPPCPPKVEVGTPPRAKNCCVSTIKTPDLSAFFPLDARNKELNRCIEKWTKKDPSQVISMCSKFAQKTSTTMSQKCPDVTGPDKYIEGYPKKGMETLRISANTRQLAQRWSPSAVGYLAATALLVVYVTEWKAILRHVPFYSKTIQEETSHP